MRITYGQPARGDAAVHVVFAAKDVVLTRAAQAVDEKMSGALRRAAGTARFEGDLAQIVEIPAPGGLSASRLLLVGLGVPGKADNAAFERIGATIVARLLVSGETVITVDFDGVGDLATPVEEAAARLAHGATLRCWRFDKYRTRLKPQQKPSLDELAILNAPENAAAAHVRLAPLAEAVAFTRELVSEPGNVIYPESFVERCRALEKLGVEIEVLDEDEMRAHGMGALLGVAQGSARRPKLLIMKWNGTGDTSAKPVLFVGKGVTFDSGGISIKPAAGMEDMKWDMGGAGAVAGAMMALAGRKANAHIVGVCGLVENMPDGNAQRPGDVVTSMSGQTIEVVNTDAEGRLVLCDAMWYAQERFKPEIMVDLATLTGAMIVALGNEHGGLFSNDDDLAADLAKAGRETGDKLWRFPLGDAYNKMIDSQIADMKNAGARNAGSITAAQFLGRYVKDGVKWAHLDIAGMVWASAAGTLWDKGATGYGVRLLDRFVEAVAETK